jgi:hypothetical protein
MNRFFDAMHLWNLGSVIWKKGQPSQAGGTQRFLTAFLTGLTGYVKFHLYNPMSAVPVYLDCGIFHCEKDAWYVQLMFYDRPTRQML